MDKNHQLVVKTPLILQTIYFSVENWVITKRSFLEIAVVFYLQIYYLEICQRGAQKGSCMAIPKNRQSLIQLLLNSLIIMIENDLYENLYFKTGYEEYISGFHRFFLNKLFLLYLDGYLELKFYHNQKSLLKNRRSFKIFELFNKTIYKNYKRIL